MPSSCRHGSFSRTPTRSPPKRRSNTVAKKFSARGFSHSSHPYQSMPQGEIRQPGICPRPASSARGLECGAPLRNRSGKTWCDTASLAPSAVTSGASCLEMRAGGGGGNSIVVWNQDGACIEHDIPPPAAGATKRTTAALGRSILLDADPMKTRGSSTRNGPGI